MQKKSGLPGCEAEEKNIFKESFTLLIFGGSGDLSRRKLLPALFYLYQEGAIKNFTIIALGRRSLTDIEYRNLIKESLTKAAGKNVAKLWSKFSKNLFYEQIAAEQEQSYGLLCDRIRKSSTYKTGNLLYYLAAPPIIVPQIVKGLAAHNLCRAEKNAKIIIEKPFGFDLETAKELNKFILQEFDESQIYRIDHYLGKETVQNIMFFRFANSIFEPLWNRNYIDYVTITVAEKIGVENRAKFYEKIGVIRDIVQNHIMQLVSLVAMEAPAAFTADLIRNEKVKVLRNIRRLARKEIYANTIIGQYTKGKIDGRSVIAYCKETDIARDSKTATYFAGKFYIDNWRWVGVPFYVRTGKRLAKRITEIDIQFKQQPLQLLGRVCDIIQANSLNLKIQPHEEIILNFNVKHPGVANIPHLTSMVFNYQDTFQVRQLSAYQRLLLDCFKGDQTLFARNDEVELLWEIVDPIINAWERKKNFTIPIYTAGSWGPTQAAELIAKDKHAWNVA